ncbi:hypothetical protein AB6A40_000018 [Gnathostoma spinigerum]|uniref:alpha-glucosidase n=1 Tax=Gnathostoma spinigerum TaxID=75299 RepID=A0ABD6E7E8_9BILA
MSGCSVQPTVDIVERCFVELFSTSADTDEKMADSTTPLAENKKLTEVINMEGGDAKFAKGDDAVDVHTSPQMIGLTKEELEKYREDPFWKPLRLVMFILFWLVWIAMFAGAIIIVVLSPKCAGKKEVEWWRTKVSYKIFTPSFRDEDGNGIGDFKGVEAKLDDVRKLGVQNIWLTPVLATQKDDFLPYDVIDFNKVDERFGTMDDLKSLISATHSRGMHFVMDLPISTTSVKHVWFEAAKSGGEYRNYYITKKASDVRGDRNYITPVGSDVAYLANNGKDPILNWQNPAVKTALVDVAKKFLEMGVDGFHVVGVSQLMKNLDSAEYANAAISALNGFDDALDEYIESNTVLKEKKIVVFASLDDMQKLKPHDHEHLGVTSLEYLIDNSMNKLTNETCRNGLAHCLRETLENSLKQSSVSKLPHVWQVTDFDVSRPTSRFDKAAGNLLTFVQLALPGALEFYYGQEIGLSDTDSAVGNTTGVMQWNDEANAGFTSYQGDLFFKTTKDYKTVNYKTEYALEDSPIKTFQNTAKLRQREENFALAPMKMMPRTDDIIVFSRIQSVDNATVGAGFIVVANFGAASEIDISPLIPSDRRDAGASFAAVSDTVTKYNPRQHVDLTKPIELQSNQGVIVRF